MFFFLSYFAAFHAFIPFLSLTPPILASTHSALSEHTCLTNHTIGWDNSKIITTNRRYHQRLCLEAWHINSAHAPLNRDDGGLLPDAYLHLVRKKAAN